jgi:endonuclease/exonuclease/phosphatase (EEP) superfamily protein YafD
MAAAMDSGFSGTYAGLSASPVYQGMRSMLAESDAMAAELRVRVEEYGRRVKELSEQVNNIPVRNSDADLVVLVDAKRRRWGKALSEIAALYPYRAPQALREGAPVILFSRFPIVREKVVRPPRGQRPYLLAELAVDGQPLMVVGVHPSSPSPGRPGHSRQRNHELDHIAAMVGDADQPMIVAGDFNTTPWSPHFQDLITAGGLRNASDGHGYIATWPEWFWPALIPIDHVLLKGRLAVTTIRRGPAIGSDHYPLLADLRLLADP